MSEFYRALEGDAGIVTAETEASGVLVSMIYTRDLEDGVGKAKLRSLHIPKENLYAIVDALRASEASETTVKESELLVTGSIRVGTLSPSTYNLPYWRNVEKGQLKEGDKVRINKKCAEPLEYLVVKGFLGVNDTQLTLVHRGPNKLLTLRLSSVPDLDWIQRWE